VASGTTPKLLANERDIRTIGYGGMLLESFVAMMAMIAATVLDPGVFFAINSPAGVVGKEAIDAVAKISAWGFPVTVEQMQLLANAMGETSLFARTGGAPSLAVGMASIFGSAFGQGLMAMWYHFAIMFEAIFILTTLDAGTRVGRFMLQDMLGNIWPKLGETSWPPSAILSSALVVAGWGYFLYIGVIDPNGGVNILWPLFGIANQMLAAIALSVATAILVKSDKIKFAWVTALPLTWLIIITSTAAWQKIMSDDSRIGFVAAAHDLTHQLELGLLPPDKAISAPQLIANLQLDAVITLSFAALLWLIVLDMLRVCGRYLLGKAVPPLSESPYVPSRLADEWVRD
jgi:carbon starvation protein